MPETAEQYRSRLSEYVKDQDPLVIQRETASRLVKLLEGISPERLKRQPAPGKWSIAEILAHLAEDEMATSWRYRQMIEHDGIALPGFDQDLWAHLGRYEAWDPREALELFRLLREANLRMLANLSPEQWAQAGEHLERGKLTVKELARHMAAHDINHIKQIEELLASSGPSQ